MDKGQGTGVSMAANLSAVVSFSPSLGAFPVHFLEDRTVVLPSAGHQDAVVRADAFLSVMDGKRDNLVVQTNQALAQNIKANRQKLASLRKTIILCGRQNFALRGPRDAAILRDGQCTSETSFRLGNFGALLDFGIEAGDMCLAEHLIPSNATYTSAQIQNELDRHYWEANTPIYCFSSTTS